MARPLVRAGRRQSQTEHQCPYVHNRRLVVILQEKKELFVHLVTAWLTDMDCLFRLEAGYPVRDGDVHNFAQTGILYNWRDHERPVPESEMWNVSTALEHTRI
jgi:hypothetical protein